jgi:undecaprenyl-diphosphatase
MATVAAFYFYGVYRKDIKLRYASVDTFAITVINMLLGSLIGIFYYEPRPFVHNKVNLLVSHAADTSFPSDHSLGTMSIALGINNYYKICGKILIILSLLVGISRVYIGVHYPMDVLGSYLVVLIVNFVYCRLLRDRIRTMYTKIEEEILCQARGLLGY